MAAAMPAAPTTAPVAAASFPTATAERVAIAIPRETTGGRRRRRSRRSGVKGANQLTYINLIYFYI